VLGLRYTKLEAAMPTPTQSDKATAFRNLHRRKGAFIIPNPWDAGTARLLAHLGFEALATTSAGFAFSRGRPDGAVSRDETLDHALTIVDATDLPVSADLEGGFADAPKAVGETIRLAAAAGLVGGSIEDATGRKDDPIYAFPLAVERVRAAAEMAHGLPFPFTLTARSENFLCGRPDLADTIRRLQAFQDAGADVLYAPGIKNREEIAAVVKSVDRPINVLAGIPGALSLTELAELGVKRISVGGALARAALGAVLTAAREMREHGTFTFADAATPFGEINAIFAGWEKR
jgi:2-methylisocitrate lyase-like PEP mutase family enzyme